jgi:hypothetical protein
VSCSRKGHPPGANVVRRCWFEPREAPVILTDWERVGEAKGKVESRRYRWNHSHQNLLCVYGGGNEGE